MTPTRRRRSAYALSGLLSAAAVSLAAALATDGMRPAGAASGHGDGGLPISATVIPDGTDGTGGTDGTDRTPPVRKGVRRTRARVHAAPDVPAKPKHTARAGEKAAKEHRPGTVTPSPLPPSPAPPVSAPGGSGTMSGGGRSKGGGPAGEACVFARTGGAAGRSRFGWGWRISGTGTYVFGAPVDPPAGAARQADAAQRAGAAGRAGAGPGAGGAWHEEGTRSRMLAVFGVGVPPADGAATAPYTGYRCEPVARPDVAAARAAVDRAGPESKGEPALTILAAYGATGLPWKIPPVAPGRASGAREDLAERDQGGVG